MAKPGNGRLQEGYWVSLGIMLLALTVNALIYAKLGGISHGGDTGRYLNAADAIIQGIPLTGKEPSYIGYIWVLALLKVVFGTSDLVVPLQIFLSSASIGLAAYAVWKSAGKYAALAAGCLLAFNFKVQMWNMFIITESLYISAMLLCFAFADLAFGAESPRRSRWITWAGVGCALVAFLVRPQGIFVPLSLAIAFVTWRSRSLWWRRAIPAIMVSVCIALFLFVKKTSATEVSIVDNTINGTVIWGQEYGRVLMPKMSAFSANTEPGRLFEYVLAYPFESISLGVKRIAMELNPVRTYFSFGNKAISSIYLIMILSGIAHSCWKRVLSKESAVFALALVGSHLLLVGATFADYDVRFYGVVTPVLIFISSLGWHEVVMMVLSRRGKESLGKPFGISHPN